MKNKASKNKKEDFLIAVRDAILLNEGSEENEDMLEFLDMEARLLYEKGWIDDPSFLLRKGFSVKEVQ